MDCGSASCAICVKAVSLPARLRMLNPARYGSLPATHVTRFLASCVSMLVIAGAVGGMVFGFIASVTADSPDWL